ncbi:MAG: SUMF1/EgtB/PvdO family nonheme iron enzyme [Planctomycetota bacterium]|nr:SUMF1/EgtB/PvdO family nonheme iron enzyme [Planctomycetota bacterium]
MSIEKLDELHRQAKADPHNRDLSTQIYIVRARLEGPDVYLELLDDLERWSNSGSALQDAAIAAVARRMSENFDYVSTQLYSCADQSFRIANFIHRESHISLNLIPGHKFAPAPKGTEEEDFFIRQVLGVKPFLIGRFPVLQSEWDRISGEDMSAFRDDDLPVNCLGSRAVWDWLRETRGLRMLSDLEWMIACRGGRASSPFWGRGDWKRYCWFDENSGGPLRAEAFSVRLHEKASAWNAFGLIDMLGNVEEWVILKKDGEQTPFLKGGSWKSPVKHSLAESRRFSYYGGENHMGVRVCASIPRGKK